MPGIIHGMDLEVQVQRVHKTYRYLFMTSEGRRISFYIGSHCQGSDAVTEIIKEGGGILTNEESEADFKLCEKKTDNAINSGSLPYSYILDCLTRKELLDVKHYRDNVLGLRASSSGEQRKDNGDSRIEDMAKKMREIVENPTIFVSSNDLKGRMKYTYEDDVKIVEFLVSKRQGLKIGGNAVWNKMEVAKVTAHTSQSMRARFFKTILPNIESYDFPPKWADFFRRNDFPLSLDGLHELREHGNEKELREFDSEEESRQCDAKSKSPRQSPLSSSDGKHTEILNSPQKPKGDKNLSNDREKRDAAIKIGETNEEHNGDLGGEECDIVKNKLRSGKDKQLINLKFGEHDDNKINKGLEDMAKRSKNNQGPTQNSESGSGKRIGFKRKLFQGDPNSDNSSGVRQGVIDMTDLDDLDREIINSVTPKKSCINESSDSPESLCSLPPKQRNVTSFAGRGNQPCSVPKSHNSVSEGSEMSDLDCSISRQCRNPKLGTLSKKKQGKATKRGASCTQNSPPESCTENSLLESSTQNSPPESCTQNSLLESSTQNSPPQSYTQNSPPESCTQNSPSESCTQNSPPESCTQNSPLESSTQNSLLESSTQNSSPESCTQNSPPDSTTSPSNTRLINVEVEPLPFVYQKLEQKRCSRNNDGEDQDSEVRITRPEAENKESRNPWVIEENFTLTCPGNMKGRSKNQEEDTPQFVDLNTTKERLRYLSRTYSISEDEALLIMLHFEGDFSETMTFLNG